MSNLFLPSSMTGYARNQAESQYPEYWEGLVGYWDFAVQGAIALAGRAIDFSGKGNHGTLVDDVSSVPGKFGPALDFPGSGDYIVIADSLSLGITQAITVIAWVKTGDDDKAIVSHYETDGNQRAWYIGVHSDGTLRVLVTDNGTSTASHRKDYRGSVSFNDSMWHCVGFTYEGSSDTLSLYLDGVYDDNPTLDDDPNISEIHNSTGDISIGSLLSAGSPGDEITAQIDNVLLYDRPLSAREISFLSGHPKALVTPQIRVIGTVPAPGGGVTIPIMKHHYTKNMRVA